MNSKQLSIFLFVLSSYVLPRASRGEDVDFSRDVVPILKKNCARCHSGKRDKGGFSLETRAGLLKGGDSGAAVIPGKADESLLIELVSGKDPDRIMPESGRKLSTDEIAQLKAWIDAGAEWPKGEVLSTAKRSDLELRPPELPQAVEATKHPVDRLLRQYFDREEIEATKDVGDAAFLRRVYIDLIGVLPTPKEQAVLEKDLDRSALIDRLLSQRSRYAAHWLTFWNDALRNDYRGTGYIDGGRRQITSWLYAALEQNKPYDEFARDLIGAAKGADGFVKGIVWRGVVNASQRPEMQAAQNVSQVFLGVNLKCASCHDSFINEWKLSDAYALANVFSEKPLEMHRCNKPTGEVAATRFLYPQLGEIDATAPLKTRREQLAGILTSEANGRFARTIVNRLWAKMMGRGIVEPVDDMDSPPWNGELLEWLAADFVRHGYDLKHTLKRIASSAAYQSLAVDDKKESDAAYVFRGPLLKRMSAEQFVDAISRLTRNPQVVKATFMPATYAASAKADPHSGHSFVKFRSEVLKDGSVDIDVDVSDSDALWLVVDDAGDGRTHDWANWGEPRLEGPAGTLKLTEHAWRSATTGHGKVQKNKNCVKKPMTIAGKSPAYGLGTHAHSVIVFDIPKGYERFKCFAGPDGQAIKEGGSSGHSVRFTVMTDVQIRSAFATADSLTRALGRPNREQVVTERESAATTLQALELTNGQTLDDLLRSGAKNWLSQPSAPGDLVTAIYGHALGRRPSPDEVAIAEELIGQPPEESGVLDFLWILAMLPEFQLIY